MGAAGAAFNDCSRRVRALEASLREEGSPASTSLAGALERLQGHERSKLEMTVTLQSLRRAEASNVFHWQGAGADQGGGGFDPLDPHPNQLYAPGGHRCGGAGAGPAGHAGPAPAEPTEAEFRGAIAELIRGLQSTIESIREEEEAARELLLEGDP